MDKRMMADAEGLVWKEVEKGKQFVRAVGEWFGSGVEGGLVIINSRLLDRSAGSWSRMRWWRILSTPMSMGLDLGTDRR
jgi:hypothetical protein